MRIKYFHQGRWPHQSPAATFITFNALGFYKNGVDFELIAAANTREPVSSVLKRHFGIDVPINIHLLQAGFLSGQHKIVRVLGFFYLLRQPVDILITRNLSFLPFAYILRKLKKCRVVFESHDIFTDLDLFTAEVARRRKKQSRQERRYLPKADCVLCVSPHQKKLYEGYYPTQTFVLANTGVRPYQRFAKKEKYQYTLGYIGSLQSKNYDLSLLLQGVAATRATDIRLLFVGAKSEEQRADVMRLARKYGVEQRVDVLPWMDPAEVDRVKARIDVGCCPLAYSERNRIAMPLKVLEYLSAGIPVLHTDLKVDDFIVQDGFNGYLVNPRPADWGQAIDAIYKDVDAYRCMSANCFLTAEQYSWDRRTESVYRFFSKNF